MKLSDLRVGMKVYLKPVENGLHFRKNVDTTELIQEDVISKVGTKYFYIEGHTKSKFGIGHHNILMDISPYEEVFHIYTDKQQILDESEFAKLCSTIRNVLGEYKDIPLTLTQLRRIHTIIKEK